MKKALFYIFILLQLSAAADTFDEVVTAIKSANSAEVAKYFNSNVELTILTSEGVYSKQQAEIIVKNFLSRDISSGFVLWSNVIGLVSALLLILQKNYYDHYSR